MNDNKAIFAHPFSACSYVFCSYRPPSHGLGHGMLSTLRRDLASKSWWVDAPLIVLAWWAAFWLRFNL